MDGSKLPWNLPTPGADRPLDNRGLAESIGTIMNLFVLSIFLIGLFAALNTATQGAEIAQRNQMEAEGQKVAGQLATVDRLVRGSDSTGQIGRHISLSERIGNNKYTITVVVNGPDDQYLVLETDSSRMKATIPFATETPVTETTVEGGDIYIVRQAGESNITIVPEE